MKALYTKEELLSPGWLDVLERPIIANRFSEFTSSISNSSKIYIYFN